MDDDALLAALGIEAKEPEHHRASPCADRRLKSRHAETIASRRKCQDFETFRLLFEQVQRELDKDIRETRPFELKAEIVPDQFFIVGGQKAYVAEKAKEFTNAQGRRDARLRVIFDNGTESNMLHALASACAAQG